MTSPVDTFDAKQAVATLLTSSVGPDDSSILIGLVCMLGGALGSLLCALLAVGPGGLLPLLLGGALLVFLTTFGTRKPTEDEIARRHVALRAALASADAPNRD